MSASRALSCSLSGTQVSPTWTLPSTMIAMSTCLAPSGMGSGSSVCGSWTGLPSISSGVTTMKMISSTRQTSTSGVTLISDLTAFSPLPASLAARPNCMGSSCRPGDALLLDEEVDQLRRGVGHLHLQALEHVGEVVEHPGRGNGHAEAEGGGDEGLGDTGRDRADAARTRERHAAEGVDDADHGTEQADEGSGGGDRRQAADALLQVGVGDEGLALEGAHGGLDDVVALHGRSARGV